MPTLIRLITYLYTGDYEDSTGSSTADGGSLVTQEHEKEEPADLERDENVAQARET